MTTKAKKYVTMHEGTDFRTIAKIMTEKGYTMNHATARNLLISAIKNVFSKTASKSGKKMSEDALESLIKDQEMHNALSEALYLAYTHMRKNNG